MEGPPKRPTYQPLCGGFEGEKFYLGVLNDGPDYALRLEVEFEYQEKGTPCFVIQGMDDGDVLLLWGLSVKPLAVISWLLNCEHRHPPLESRIQKLLAFGESKLCNGTGMGGPVRDVAHCKA